VTHWTWRENRVVLGGAALPLLAGTWALPGIPGSPLLIGAVIVVVAVFYVLRHRPSEARLSTGQPATEVKPGRPNSLSRRTAVWLIAIASQILIIGGVFAWGNYLALTATGSLSARPDAVISVWVSDPNWHVAPDLNISQDALTLDLSIPRGRQILVTDPGAEVVIVFWADAQLIDPGLGCLLIVTPVTGHCPWPISWAKPGAYRRVLVPKEQAKAYDFNALPPTSGANESAQVFRETASDYYASGSGRGNMSLFPLGGNLSASLYTTTATGWEAYVPSAGAAGDPVGGCSPRPSKLPAAIAAAIGAEHQRWYATPCPAPKVQLFPSISQHFDNSSERPTNANNDAPIWTNQYKDITSSVGDFFIEVADPAITAAAQRDLLLAGVMDGIAGGLLAAWLVAFVTLIVKRFATSVPDQAQSQQSGKTEPPETRS
jgi:hypothetical protein